MCSADLAGTVLFHAPTLEAILEHDVIGDPFSFTYHHGMMSHNMKSET